MCPLTLFCLDFPKVLGFSNFFFFKCILEDVLKMKMKL